MALFKLRWPTNMLLTFSQQQQQRTQASQITNHDFSITHTHYVAKHLCWNKVVVAAAFSVYVFLPPHTLSLSSLLMQQHEQQQTVFIYFPFEVLTCIIFVVGVNKVEHSRRTHIHRVCVWGVKTREPQRDGEKMCMTKERQCFCKNIRPPVFFFNENDKLRFVIALRGIKGKSPSAVLLLL